MMIRLLTKQAFLATCRGRMKDVTNVGDAVVDVWPYVAEAKRGLGLAEAAVEHRLVDFVYRSEDERFDHVLIPYGVENVYLAIVVDRVEQDVHDITYLISMRSMESGTQRRKLHAPLLGRQHWRGASVEPNK